MLALNVTEEGGGGREEEAGKQTRRKMEGKRRKKRMMKKEEKEKDGRTQTLDFNNHHFHVLQSDRSKHVRLTAHSEISSCPKSNYKHTQLHCQQINQLIC